MALDIFPVPFLQIPMEPRKQLQHFPADFVYFSIPLCQAKLCEREMVWRITPHTHIRYSTWRSQADRE